MAKMRNGEILAHRIVGRRLELSINNPKNHIATILDSSGWVGAIVDY
jgi:hypothetical protein